MRVNPPTLQRPPGSGGDAAGAGGESYQSEEEEEETRRQVDRETDMQETDRLYNRLSYVFLSVLRQRWWKPSL